MTSPTKMCKAKPPYTVLTDWKNKKVASPPPLLQLPRVFTIMVMDQEYAHDHNTFGMQWQRKMVLLLPLRGKGDDNRRMPP